MRCWPSCSAATGGQLMEAQRYPADYNGIVAASPATNWDRFTITEFWPQVLMNQPTPTPGEPGKSLGHLLE
jgi:feruloyl esterase